MHFVPGWRNNQRVENCRWKCWCLVVCAAAYGVPSGPPLTPALSSPRLQQVCHHVQYSWALCGILTRVFLVKWILYPELQGISFSFGATTIFLSFCLQMIFQIGKSLCSQRLFNSACMFLLESCLAPILVEIATSSWHIICWTCQLGKNTEIFVFQKSKKVVSDTLLCTACMHFCWELHM